MNAKPCRVCAHPEGEFLSRCLVGGQSPRQAARRYSQLTRRDLTRHRDTCLLREETTERTKDA